MAKKPSSRKSKSTSAKDSTTDPESDKLISPENNDHIMYVGWEEWVALPDLALPAIKAKVDTGAKTSALHAFALEPFSWKGKPKIRFGIHPLTEDPELVRYCVADLVDEREITSSNGETERRYIISTTLKMGEKEWAVEISLSNRESMNYRMLLGRTSLDDHVVINPTGSCLTGMLSPSAYNIKVPRKDESSRTLKIGILSREPDCYSTKRLVEAAENRGHLVEVINTTRCYINITSQKPEVRLEGKLLEGFDAIIPRIGASITFYGLAVVRQFESMGVYTLNTSDAIGRSRDKLFAHQILARNGIGMPTTSFAHSPNDTKDLIEIVGGAPLVVKLLEGSQGKGVVLAETKKAGESVIQAFRGLKANFLVQEFIKESAGTDIRCFVVGSKVVAAMKREGAEGDYRSNLHQGGKASAIKITPKEREAATRAARAMGLKVAGVDLLRSNDGPKILEVNSSPGLEGIEAVTGKDIANLIIEYVEKHAKTKRFHLRSSQNLEYSRA